MISLEDFLQDLQAAGIQLSLDGENLRIRAPKGALNDTLKAGLTARKAEVLQFLRRKALWQQDIPCIPRTAAMPLSFAQQRLWFVEQLQGASAVYNMPAALRLDGHLQRAALEQTLQNLLERHESLRTCFPVVDEQPIVQINPLGFALTQVSLEHLPADQQQQAIRQQALADASQPFMLDQGPLFRASLLVLGTQTHVLLLNMHHIVSDGWSMGILVKEFCSLYAALVQGLPNPLPALPVQYADYAAWQRSWLQGEVLQEQLLFWKNQLAGAPALLELPADYPRPAVQDFKGGHVPFKLPTDLHERLQQLARQQGVTLFMLLLAAFAVVLSRHSRQADIVIGSPVANRTHRQTAGIMGFFVNLLALRLKLDGNSPFTALLQQAKDVALGAYAHQEVPFDQLIGELLPTRSMSHAPVFQVMLVLQNNDMPAVELPELTASPLDLGGAVAKFDLTLYVGESADGSLEGGLEYSTALFKPDTVRRLGEHLQVLLAAVVTEPQKSIGELPLLTTAETSQLQAWGQASVAQPLAQETLVSRFETQAALTPDRLAVSFEGRHLTYRELNQQANRLAHYLLAVQKQHRLGSKPLIALYMERSLDMVVGILAILKSGGAYVPLDTHYPAERLAFMLEDSAAPLLLTHQVAGWGGELGNTLLVELETLNLAAHSVENPVLQNQPDDLAYVIYTSGSTGKPKGCLVTHHNAVRLFTATDSLFGFGEQDVWTLFHSYAFDFSVWELWGALLYGGRLVVVPYWVSRSPEDFYALLQAEGVTVLNQTPSAFRQLMQVDTQTEAAALALRWVVFGGEALEPSLLQPWFQRYGDQQPQLVNMYGITETTVHVTWQLLAQADSLYATSRIGRPLADLGVHLLDEQGQLVPVGVAGEMFVSGAGVSRGYLNRPDLTSERFVYVELAGQTQRVYRSGDLARWLADGTLEYLGRIDQQVKLRGFRIELGEIEALLARYSGITQATVMLYTADANPRLVAYAVAVEPPAAEALQAYLRQHLPDYMLPAQYVWLDALPLTINGKIDRKALPAPERVAEEVVALATPLEELLAGLWADVLQQDKPGRTANFFTLGGHSLLATQLASRMRATFNTDVPLRALFEYPVLWEQADWLAQQTAGSHLPVIASQPETAAKVLSFAQQRLWLLNYLAGGNATYNIPAALRLRGKLDENALRRALQTLVERHQSLRMRFPARNGQPQLQVAAVYDPLEVVEADFIQEVVASHAARQFDLSSDALLAVRLLRLAADDHILLFNMHHIISDGWSMAVLIREWAACYNAFRRGIPPELPALTFTYSDYAAWQREWMAGDVLEKQLGYWRQQLAGLPERLELPTDYPRPAVRQVSGGQVNLTLDAELGLAVQALCQQQGVTLYMLLLAVFQVLLTRHGAGQDIPVGTPIANRNHGQTEGLVGFFVNTLVMRSQVDEQQPFNQLLAQVRQMALEAYAHQDVPFEYLVDALKPVRSLNHTPLFQVIFTVQDNAGSLPALDGLILEPLEQGIPQAKFDLTLGVVERDGQLHCCWEYASDLYAADTVARFARRYQSLLQAVVAHPQAIIGELPLLDAAECQQLQDWNATGSEPLPYPTVVAWFEAQASLTPQRIAVSQGGQSLTYALLDKRANQLAHYLRVQGVASGMLVGICMNRSLDSVTGLLAILKAGAAYVPFDPAYPVARLQYMLTDSAVPFLLTQSHLREVLPHEQTGVICLDTDWAAIAACSDLRGQAYPAADDLAYVIYTSGSTGQPKGVMVPHRGLGNLVAWHQQAFAVTAEDHASQLANPAFDAAVWELWPYLCAGASVSLIPADLRMIPHLVRDWLVSSQLTVTFLPTPLAEAVLALPWPSTTRLRYLLTGGDKLKCYPPAGLPFEVVNNYGPTENTVVTTSVGVPAYASEQVPERLPAIGKPIRNTRVYVLDAQQRMVPIGVAGELCVAGESLADGYWQRPALTEERFVPLVLLGTTERVYKTGDRVRWLANGTLEYLGRIDQQVKLRGFRVELGEIESQLGQCPEVQECVVVLDDQVAANPRLLAYVVPQVGANLSSEALRARLLEILPDYMVPAAFVMLETLPLTGHGKVDYRALPAVDEQVVEQMPPLPAHAVQTALLETIHRVWCRVLQRSSVGLRENFFEAGGHSLLLVQLHAELESALGQTLPIVDLFQYPDIQGFAAHLGQQPTLSATTGLSPATRTGNDSIAIIGMAGRFPGANDIATFWANLCAGKEAIRVWTDEELLAAGVPADWLKQPNYVKASGFLEQVECFDAAFFGYSPREAEIMDPQHRLFLETAWAAVEDAGYDVERLQQRVGVFAGSSMSSYLLGNLMQRPDLLETVGRYALTTANDKDFLASRTAYKLNLRGPAVTVQTACSTSLVAVSQACQSLLQGECEMALAGGVGIGVPQASGYLYQPDMILSPDGHCRAFDAAAQGTVGGSGVGVVLLKPLQQALADGDPIYAVIKAAAINNDGADKVGFTAPGVSGQTAVIRAALDKAGVHPDTIGYVEAHGTATVLGDPIEISALTQAYTRGTTVTERRAYCAIGSVKTNVGHLDTAAGVTGLIKAALALKHGKIPPSLHFTQPNPAIDFASSPFFVNTALADWPAGATPLRAGVSSFGMGGTNAHVILEAAPVSTTCTDPGLQRPLPLLLSARTPEALEAASQQLARYLQGSSGVALADVAYTLAKGRKRFACRRVVVSPPDAALVAALEAPLSESDYLQVANSRPRPVAFMFTGQGAQYVGMGQALYQHEPVFRQQLDDCCEVLLPLLGMDLRTVLYPPDHEQEAAAIRLQQTAITQPALFVVEYALAQLWLSWGVQPVTLIGHSIGEYVAACLAGVMSLADALQLVAVRGQLMQSLPAGDMLSVSLDKAALEPLLAAGISLAAHNAPARCVVSGTPEAMAALEQQLLAKDISCQRLQTSHAFHSAMMEPILARFTQQVASICLSPPQLPFLSNVTGEWITSEQATDPNYWAQHLRQTVHFSDGLAVLLRDYDPVLLEVGPGRTLASFARQQTQNPVLQSLPHPQQAKASPPDALPAALVTTLGLLWQQGVAVDWDKFFAPLDVRRMALPTYPFARERYWIDAPVAGSVPKPKALLTQTAADVADWFYLPEWKSAQLVSPSSASWMASPRCWLLLGDALGISLVLANRLESWGQTVVHVMPKEAPNYADLLASLAQQGRLPDYCLHLATLGAAEGTADTALLDLLALVQALGQQQGMDSLRLWLVSDAMQAVTGCERLSPAKAALAGAMRVIGQEYAGLRCSTLDLELPAKLDDYALQRLTEQMLGDLADSSVVPMLAYRGAKRWIPDFVPLHLEAPEPAMLRLRQRGVYLITGGFGGIGMLLARYLAQHWQANLILLGRSDPEQYQASIQWLEAQGVSVLALSADVANLQQMQDVMQKVQAQFGELHGVIHAAGLGGHASFRAIAETDATFIHQQFQPKVYGTQVLAQVLQAQPLDFCLLMSSLATVLGGLGFFGYAAANAFMDAFAHQQRDVTDTPWIIANWDGWQLQENASAAEPAILPADGMAALQRVLAQPPIRQTLISVTDLQARLVRWLTPPEVQKTASPASHARPQLTQAYVAPDTPLAETLVAIMEALLGISPIGLNDDFFELGGDSLLGTRLAAKIRETCHLALPLHVLFERPTVAGIVAHWQENGVQQPKESPVTVTANRVEEEF